MLPLLLSRRGVENADTFAEPQPFPFTNLAGMQTILAGQFVERLGTFGRFEGYLELELSAVSVPFGHETDLHMLCMTS